MTVDGAVLARCLADRPRPDLARAGIGDGSHGFEVLLRDPPSRDRDVEIAILREADGRPLPGSPRRLGPPRPFSRGGAETIAAILSEPGDEAALAERAAFLEGQARALLGRRSGGMPDPDARRRERALQLQDPDVLGTPAPGPDAARRPLALFVDERVPLAGRDAGSSAALSHVASLRRLGFDVAVACAEPGEVAALPDDPRVAVLGRPWYGSVEEALRAHPDAFALVYLHRSGVACAYLDLARVTQPAARIVHSVADLHWLRLMRRADVESRPELRRAASAMRRREEATAARADAVVTHSPVEAAMLARALGPMLGDAGLARARVHVVPWTVPTAAPPPFAERSGAVFAGAGSHAPNADAATTIARVLAPRLLAAAPGLTVTLRGGGMPGDLPGNVVDGDRSATPAEAFGGARLSLAPLSYGAGVKGKVLESLGLGIPCVMSPVAAEGIDLPEALRPFVIDHEADPDAFVAAVVELHADGALNGRLGEVGRAFVEEAYGEAAVDAALAKALR